ncbi:hypothetical protein ASD11_03740 [Aeromicrobium sp. Root495]|nr:hypothetical protein ASD11_03740 [Aeromicrobium sp. Root495]
MSSVLAVLLVATLVLLLQGEDEGPALPGPTGEGAPAGLAPFYAQEPTWTTCGRYRCTRIRVPLDYDRPAGPTMRLAVRMLPARDGSTDRLLLVNPGGPGGSAVEYVPIFAGLMTSAMRERLSVVGVDPRGVGTSQELQCLDADALDRYLDLDATPDDPGEEKAWTAAPRRLAEGCVKESGDLAAHMSTQETARDLDVVRAALGQRRLDYYGASYGTQLGATFTTLFPRRVGRMVLDGGVDVGQDRRALLSDQAAALEKAWGAFVRWCGRQEDCALPAGRAAATAMLLDVVEAADERPLPSDGSIREAREVTVLRATAFALSTRRAWPALLVAIGRAQYDDGTAFRQLDDAYVLRSTEGRYDNNAVVAGVAVRCLDDPQETSADEARDDLGPRLVSVSPLFGRYLAWSASLCNGWRPRGKPQEGVERLDAALPVLVLGTTGDPVTPYRWSTRLAADLGSAVLVTREGDGHTAYGLSRCVDRSVATYLLRGRAPRAAVRCERGR